MLYNFFQKKSKDTTGTRIVSEDQQLADDINKSITRKSKKRKVYLSYRDNI